MKFGGATTLPLKEWMKQRSCTYENYSKNDTYQPKMTREAFDRMKRLTLNKMIYDSYQSGIPYQEYISNPENPRVSEENYNEIGSNEINALGAPPMLERSSRRRSDSDELIVDAVYPNNANARAKKSKKRRRNASKKTNKKQKQKRGRSISKKNRK